MKQWLVLLLLILATVAGFGWYIAQAPPPPVVPVQGRHEAGAKTIHVRWTRGFSPDQSVVVQTPRTVLQTQIAEVDPDRRLLHLSDPLPEAIPAEGPGRVAHAETATVVAIFERRAELRRLPRTDSRVIAYAPEGMQKPVLRQADGWVKVRIRPELEGWIPASDAHIEPAGPIQQARVPGRRPIRQQPFADEDLIEWEGLLAGKLQRQQNGETIYAFRIVGPDGTTREVPATAGAWRSFREGEYLVARREKGLTAIPAPVGTTQPGRPYEILEDRSGWLRIQVEDQGWAEHAACRLEIRLSYSLTRRQMLRLWAAELLSRR